MRWIGGAYFVHTDRFVSTGNMVDLGLGVYPVYRNPSTNPINPQVPDFLSDSQKQDAWALFGDVIFEINDHLELDTALRYDEDTRENTTETPQRFSLRRSIRTRSPASAQAHVERDAAESHVALQARRTPTLYGGWSRGFRSGGFNQTGVGAVADACRHLRCRGPVRGRSGRHLGGGREGPVPRPAPERRAERVSHRIRELVLLRVPGRELHPEPRQPPKVVYKGAELELNARFTDQWTGYISYGHTDSEITEAPAGSTVEATRRPWSPAALSTSAPSSASRSATA